MDAASGCCWATSSCPTSTLICARTFSFNFNATRQSGIRSYKSFIARTLSFRSPMRMSSNDR